MIRRFRSTGALSLLIAMTFSLGETALVAVCDARMAMASVAETPQAGGSDMAGMVMPMPADQADPAGQDHGSPTPKDGAPCPLALGAGQGCVGTLSIPAAAVLITTLPVASVAPPTAPPAVTSLLRVGSIFHPPK